MSANNMQDAINQMVANNMLHHHYPTNPNLVQVKPVQVDNIYDGHGATGPLYLIGYLAGTPVYRTTHTVAHYKEGNWPGQYQIHWPPLFPNIWVPECMAMQLDITIRQEIAPFIPPIEGVEFDEDDDKVYNDVNMYDYADDHDEDDQQYNGYDSDEEEEDDYYGYEDVNDNDDNDIKQDFDIIDLTKEQEELEATFIGIDEIDIEWINSNDDH